MTGVRMPSDLLAPIPYCRGIEMSKADLAEHLGETVAMLDTWARKGCPCRRTGSIRSPLIFDSAQVIAWRKITAAIAHGGEAAGRLARLECERDALEYELYQTRVAAGLEKELAS